MSENSTWKDVYNEFCKAENASTQKDTEGVDAEGEEIGTSVSWKEIDWDVKRAEIAKLALESEKELVPEDKKVAYESFCFEYWDKFYMNNKNKFFKERNYLHFQFKELAWKEHGNELDNCTVFEVGCGTGSTLFPLLNLHKHTNFYVCDLSESAIKIVKEHALYAEGRCQAFVYDMSIQEDSIFRNYISLDSVDYVLLIFMLSAVPPQRMNNVLTKLYNCMKPGGCILFRDYGLYDLTQLRFYSKHGRKLADNYYVRHDGTVVYYFTTEYLCSLFESCGFVCEDVHYDARELRNRARKINMYRVWVNAKCRKPYTTSSSSSSASSPYSSSSSSSSSTTSAHL